MVEPRDYKDRLAWAMKEAKISTTDLAFVMKLSYQAVKKVLDGKSKAFSAANNEAAAACLLVSSRWLATGKGQARTQPAADVSFSIIEDPEPPQAQEPRQPPYRSIPPASEQDEWIQEAVRTLQALSREDRRAAVLNLRVFVDKLDKPDNGQALPVAA